MDRFNIALGKKPKEQTPKEEPKERILTELELAVVRELYQKKADHEDDTTAYVTVAKKIIMKKWNGQHPVEDNCTDVMIQPGTTLKIVMVSRFGDCGLTDDLNAVNGYHIRLNFEDPSIKNIRRNP